MGVNRGIEYQNDQRAYDLFSTVWDIALAPGSHDYRMLDALQDAYMAFLPPSQVRHLVGEAWGRARSARYAGSIYAVLRAQQR